MTPTNCPDCSAGLKGADRCRCGWVLRHGGARASEVARLCATEGCQGKPLPHRAKCENCDTRERQEKSAARCAELGLHTVEAKREFCRQLLRSFGTGPSFDTWAKKITQRTVDLIALHAGKGDLQCLERLRTVGAIDGRNKLIPVEARAVAADAYRQERARELVKVQAELAEQRENMERELQERGRVQA